MGNYKSSFKQFNLFLIVFCLFLKKKNSIKLLNVLRAMPHRVGPDEFFSLPGRKASVCI